MLGSVTCCGETFKNELVSIGGQCWSAELKSPHTTHRIYELAMLNEVLAVNCHGYLESVRSNMAMMQPAPFFKDELSSTVVAGR